MRGSVIEGGGIQAFGERVTAHHMYCCIANSLLFRCFLQVDSKIKRLD